MLAGTSTESFTTVDNAGLNDPRPPTLAIIVQPAVQITNPKAGSTVKDTVSISAKVSDAVGASNTFTFQVGNTVLSKKTVKRYECIDQLEHGTNKDRQAHPDCHRHRLQHHGPRWKLPTS